MEDVVTTPDLIYRYQMKPNNDINEVLMKDMIALNSLTQVNVYKHYIYRFYTILSINKNCCCIP